MVRRYTQPAPRVLPVSPTLEQIVQVVNDNAAKIRTLSSPHATISVPGAPSLRSNLAMEMPRRFRLKAGTLVTGEEVDLGSNDELFWIWVRRNQPPATYFCRHDQFARSAAKAIMPVPPEWLLEAFGTSSFDPSLVHTGPVPVAGGRVEIRTVRRTEQGETTKITIVDEARGWVLEQHLYDSAGQRLATAITSKHERDALTGAVVPHRVEIQWPSAQMSMKIDMGDVQVNALAGDAERLWAKPEISGFANVDLADPNLQIGPADPSGAARSAAIERQPAASAYSAPRSMPRPSFEGDSEFATASSSAGPPIPHYSPTQSSAPNSYAPRSYPAHSYPPPGPSSLQPLPGGNDLYPPAR